MFTESELIQKNIEAYLAEHQRKDLLRFLTCGSVDDGKSTLIGRLLLDTRMVYEDQLAALRKDSAKHGTTGQGVEDPALLLDGLEAERQQGITIDVAYRYFSTKKRKFIIADTPGHEQYTRNMATGASTCNLAVILIDARQGVVKQTRRHSFIVSLLGIKHLVLAVNKMDLVGWSPEIFEKISDEYTSFATRLGITDIKAFPISALKGDNVVTPSVNLPWFEGGTLLAHLETVHVASDVNLNDFRFPVQYVLRPNLEFRGFSGTLAGGVIGLGDVVMALPSERRTRIKSIVTYEGELLEAHAPMAVTFTLEDEIDLSRGDMLVQPRNVPHRDRTLQATVVWMNEQALRVGASYLLKQTTQSVTAEVTDLAHRVDVNTLEQQPASQLAMNEIGRVTLTCNRPLFYDPYTRNRATGSFILIDRLTNATLGAGMILEPEQTARERSDRWAELEDIVRHDQPLKQVTAPERAKIVRQKPVAIWMTGLSKSGKSTLAYKLEKRLTDLGLLAFVVDGLEMRLGLSKDLGFSADDRSENNRRLGEAAKLLVDAGVICIASLVAPFEADREKARELIGRDRFLEVYLNCPADVCAERDTTGMYAKARKGLVKNMPGVTSQYERPSNPDLVLATHEMGVDACIEQLLDLLKQHGVLKR
jgi:bifunctional enzyme CysN/CysC